MARPYSRKEQREAAAAAAAETRENLADLMRWFRPPAFQRLPAY